MKNVKEYISEAIVKGKLKQYYNTPINFIDLDLPSGTLWADRNIGAKTIYDGGDYYSWGELEPKKTAGTYENYKFAVLPQMNTWDFTKYNDTDKKYILSKEDDIAYKTFNNNNIGMPTKEEIEELLKHTNYKFIDIKGNKYCEFTSNNNGNILLFPLSGTIRRKSSEPERVNECFRIWAITIDGDDVADDIEYAVTLTCTQYLSKKFPRLSEANRVLANAVRAVKRK